MKRLIIAVALLAIIVPAALQAQMVETAEVKQINSKYDLGVTKKPSFSFIDLSKLSISHSYSIGFFSGGGVSGSQALYNGAFQYQIANPLTLTLNFGVLHDPSALWGGRNQLGTNTRILPSGWLDWRPSENFHMSIGFESIPGNSLYSPYSLGRNSFWRY